MVNQDNQIIELLGRNKLVSEILLSGLEVAIPERDRGIDLIAYTDFTDKTQEYISKPIQMKSSTKSVFGIWKKYSKFSNLIMAYIWYIQDENKCVTYALTYKEALEIAEKMGWTNTSSWNDKGGYSTSNPSKKLTELLKPYKMNSKKWWNKITR
tara:strand:- start:450 stop:911 length:462 start_codon:yes stop_codon:yes gene_type:complete